MRRSWESRQLQLDRAVPEYARRASSSRLCLVAAGRYALLTTPCLHPLLTTPCLHPLVRLHPLCACTPSCACSDWLDWMRHLSVELLRESPSPALRACAPVAQMHGPLARRLFNVGFMACWGELEATSRESLVVAIEAALTTPSTPTEVLQELLNLAEYMEPSPPHPPWPRGMASSLHFPW